MAGLTSDTHVIRYGVGDGDNSSPTSYPLGGSQTVYYGAVALMSGGGSTTKGYLKNAASYGSTDLVVGMVDDPAGGTFVKTGPGVANVGADGAIWMNVQNGAFFFQSGTGSDALSVTTNGQTVYYGGENTSGPIACATGSGTRPVLGVQLPQDPGIAGGSTPGSNYFPIKLNVVGGP